MSDLISRQDTLKRLCEECTEGHEKAECGRWKCLEYRVIKDMPPADRPTGEWDVPCKIASDQREHDILYEPTYNPEDGSM